MSIRFRFASSEAKIFNTNSRLQIGQINQLLLIDIKAFNKVSSFLNIAEEFYVWENVKILI